MSETLFERVRVTDVQRTVGKFRPMAGVPSHMLSHADVGDTEDVQSAVDTQPDLIALAYEGGRKVAEDAFAIERAALQRLVASAEALQSEPSEELAVLIAETVETLVSKIVGDVAIDRAWLTERARASVALIGDCDDARTMCVHPDDVALLEGAELPLTLKVDADAARGSIRIDCSAGWIEAGTALYLDALRVELGLKVMAS
jgi:flagellar assembly protein FliH